jgi:hypothetical protein
LSSRRFASWRIRKSGEQEIVSEVIKAAFAYLDHEHPTVRAALEEIRQLQERARRTVSGQEANPVCWITREQLTRVEDEGEDAWVYWAETGHVAEPDEVALYAAPIPATDQEKP